jgi:hypothetical protein
MISRLSRSVKRHPLVTFFVLAYAISWAFLPVEAVRFLPSGPLFAALIVIPITQGWAGLRELGFRMIRWRVRWYWYALALGLPLTVHLTYMCLNVAAGAGVPSLAFSSLTTFLMVFAVRLVNPADGPLGEHPGWNGVALPGLQADPLVACRHHDPGTARSRLAPAPLFPGRGWLTAVPLGRRSRDDVGGDVLVRVALQPHQRQRTPGRRGAFRRREHPDRDRLDLHMRVVGCGDRPPRFRLEEMARTCARARDDGTLGTAGEATPAAPQEEEVTSHKP